MDIKSQATSLTTIANKIVETNSRNNNRTMVRAQKEYKKLGDFLTAKTPELERFPLPNNKEIEKLANLKITNTSNSNTDSSKDKSEVKKVTPKTTTGSELKIDSSSKIGNVHIKSSRGNKPLNSLVRKTISQPLILIPSVGLIISSVAGNFIEDGASKNEITQQKLKAKQESKLKDQKKSISKVYKKNNMLSKFEEVTNKFEGFLKSIIGGVAGSMSSEEGAEDISMDGDANYPVSKIKNEAKGEYQDMEVSGGVDPSNVEVTSRYGMRGKRMHHGIDYGLKSGTPISVVQPGIVEYSGWAEGGAGNSIYINHSDGAKTVYFHLLDPSPLKNDQSIPAGTFIGKVGSTGRSTGPHLHFEYYPPGSTTRVDPEKYASKYFRFGGNVKAKPKDTPKSKASATSDAKKPQVKNDKSNSQTDAIKVVEKNTSKSVGNLIHKVFNEPKSNKKGNVGIKPKDNKILGIDILKFNSTNTDTLKEKVQDFNQLNWKSQITTPIIEQKDISYELQYKKAQGKIIALNRPSIYVLDSGGNTPRVASQPPSQNEGEGSSASPLPLISHSIRQHPSDILNTYIGSIRLA